MDVICVDVGMHHQGVFRVPGLQHEITDYKNQFERGQFVDVDNVDLYSHFDHLNCGFVDKADGHSHLYFTLRQL